MPLHASPPAPSTRRRVVGAGLAADLGDRFGIPAAPEGTAD